MTTSVILTGTGVPHPAPGRAGAGVMVRCRCSSTLNGTGGTCVELLDRLNG